MSTHIATVELSHDHIERQARCSPDRAVEELIWNALDAGGSRVEVHFDLNNMNSVSAVEVRDRGSGISFDNKEQAFGKIGESHKLKNSTTPDGRAIHGSEGRGRFKALVLGTRATWSTVYASGNEFRRYSLTITRDNQRAYTFTDPITCKGPSGTTLRVEGVDDGAQSLQTDKTLDAIVAHFAMYLKRYPGVTLEFNKKRIDPRTLIANVEVLDVISPETQTEVAKLEVVEWTFDPKGKKLFICDDRGFTWHEIPMGVQLPGLNITAYLKWPGARDAYHEHRLGIADIDPEISGILEAARNTLRDFRKRRLAEQAGEVVAQWKREQVYPYPESEPGTAIERAERQVFDIVATRVHEFHEPLRSAESSAKRLTLELVKQALETNPTGLRTILDKAIRLPREKQEELAELLAVTSFEAIIDAAKTVTQRLDVIHGFQTLIFDEDWKRRLRERTQLHRLLVHELWIFGEEYTLDSDDESLKEYLRKHIAKLERDDLAPEVDLSNIDSLNRVPDMLLSRRFFRSSRVFENLVIELKRPSLTIGSKEVVQIEEYAQLVIDEDAFNKSDYNWKFLLIGNRLDSYAESRTSEQNRPPGCIQQGKNHTVWVYTWSEVFAEAKRRYEFFRERLEVEASGARGLKYLNENYPHLLSGKGMTKKQEINLGLLDADV